MISVAGDHPKSLVLKKTLHMSGLISWPPF
jgi:hypothetical protein